MVQLTQAFSLEPERKVLEQQLSYKLYFSSLVSFNPLG